MGYRKKLGKRDRNRYFRLRKISIHGLLALALRKRNSNKRTPAHR